MTLTRTVSLLMILLDFTNDIWTLPAPSQVFMDSVNMRHRLRWLPLQEVCNATVLYSVQYQGEFELLMRNGSWMDAVDCQRIPLTHCDLTFDLGSDSNYSLQVRAQCGSRLSAWTKLSSPFNRRDTVLTEPEMTVMTAGDALQVSFDNLPLTATASVTVWKKDDEQQAVLYLLPSEQAVLHVAALQDGAVYCIEARIVLHSGLHGNSSSTGPRCVSIAGRHAAAWKSTAAITVTAVVMSGLLFASFWAIINCRPDSCREYLHKDPLPESLKSSKNMQMMMVPQVEQDEEEEERCEQVLSVDPQCLTQDY